MCLIARSWGSVIGCPCFLVGVRLRSPAMMIGRLDAIVFVVMSVGSSGKVLSHWFMGVSGSCAGY